MEDILDATPGARRFGRRLRGPDRSFNTH